MRTLMLALAAAFVAGAASATPGDIAGPEIRRALPPPSVPSGAREQAEDAIKHDLGDPASIRFRAVQAILVASIRHGAFAATTDGPVSVVCGQYAVRNSSGDDGAYSWFFVAIKRGQVLWTASNQSSGTPDEAYYSCKGAGLTNDSPPKTGQDS